MGTQMKNSKKEKRFLVAHSVNPGNAGGSLGLDKVQRSDAIMQAFCIGDDPGSQGLDSPPMRWCEAVCKTRRIIPEERGRMNMPESIPAIAWVLLLGAVMSIIALFHVSNSLIDHKTHKAAHKAAISEPECPAGTRITIIEGGRKTCLTHHVRTYAASSILVTKTVAR